MPLSRYAYVLVLDVQGLTAVGGHVASKGTHSSTAAGGPYRPVPIRTRVLVHGARHPTLVVRVVVHGGIPDEIAVLTCCGAASLDADVRSVNMFEPCGRTPIRYAHHLALHILSSLDPRLTACRMEKEACEV